MKRSCGLFKNRNFQIFVQRGFCASSEACNYFHREANYVILMDFFIQCYWGTRVRLRVLSGEYVAGQWEVGNRRNNVVRQSKGNVTREKWWVMSIWELRDRGCVIVDVSRMGHWTVRWEENWNFGLMHDRTVVKLWATIPSRCNRAHELDTIFIGCGGGGCSMSSSSSRRQRSTQNSPEFFSYCGPE
jgi:hypothetical protein